MKITGSIKIAMILLFVLAAAAGAQSLEKRHQLEIRFGMWNQTTDARSEVDGSVTVTAENNGLTGGIAYGHWLKEYLGLYIGVSFLSADVRQTVSVLQVSSETDYVIPVLFGLKYYFLPSSYPSSIKPYVKAAVGPYFGNQSETSVSLVVISESRSETAFGGQLGAGVDFILGRHFMTGISGAYNLQADFAQPIGGSANYSGPEFTINLSYLFGEGL
ncbi:MAG: outer membrane beta-barrel protein [Candidatus Zixiibacteriota bacterium]